MSKAGHGGKGKKGGGGHEEEHVSHERWLVSYADMVTLLMVLFIVLFAMSAVDSKKFVALSNGLSSGFGAQTISFTGKLNPLDSSVKETTVQPLQTGATPDLKGDLKGANTVNDKAPDNAAARTQAELDAAAAVKEVDNLRKAQRQITAALKAKNLEDVVRFRIDERGLVVTVVTSAIVFAGDRADLLPAGREIINAISPALRRLPNQIQVDGHTNQLKIPTINYPSGWELSTARASAVVRKLAANGLAQKRLGAAGYADTRPLIDPADPRSVTMNRRVDVIVLSSLPPSQRVLLASAGD